METTKAALDVIAVAPEDIETQVETAEEKALTTNVYSEIKRRMVARGVPPETIAFIHDAKTPEQKARLFAAVNEGSIRILIGSTEKMGTGMNVQERLLALHHLDAPWRPADIEQRNGRMIRQGNRYPTVFQFVHIAEGSFDGFVWQGLETKATFIAQITGGEIDDDVCEVEDVSDTVMSFSEIKAAASGNPLLVEKIGLEQEITRLRALRRVWEESRRIADFSINAHKSRQAGLEKTIATLDQAIAIRDKNTGEKFAISLMGKPFSSRELAGAEIRRLAKVSLTDAEIGRYRGFPIRVSNSRTYIRVFDKDIEFNIGESDLGVLASLDAKLRFERDREDAIREKEKNESAIASFEAELSTPWKYKARFEEVSARLKEIDAKLDAKPDSIDLKTDAVTKPSENSSLDEVRAALQTIQEMHTDATVLSKFEAEAKVSVSIEQIPTPNSLPLFPIDSTDMLLPALDIPVGVVAQLDLFGGFVTKEKARRK